MSLARTGFAVVALTALLSSCTEASLPTAPTVSVSSTASAHAGPALIIVGGGDPAQIFFPGASDHPPPIIFSLNLGAVIGGHRCPQGTIPPNCDPDPEG